MKLTFHSRRLLTMGLAAGLCGGLHALAAPAVAELPKAETVMQDAIDAMGGTEALGKIKSSRMKGRTTTPMGEVDVELFSGVNGQFLIQQRVPQFGEIRAGSDGKVAWMLNPMQGYVLLDDSQTEEFKGQASMHNLIVRLQKEFETFETVGRESFQDKDCYKVRMVTTIDEEQREQFAYFGVEDKLMVGMQVVSENPRLGTSTITMSMSGWETYGDIKMFRTITINQSGMDMVMNFSEIEFDDSATSADLFELPEEVARLAAERKANEQESESDPED